MKSIEARKLKGDAFDWLQLRGFNPSVTDSANPVIMTSNVKVKELLDAKGPYKTTSWSPDIYFINLNKKNLKKMGLL